DDIYPLSRILASDLLLVSAKGWLVKTPGETARTYQKNKNNTIEELDAANLPAYDYATHTPVVFDKEKLAEVIERYNAVEKGLLISSLYFNTVLPDVKPLIMDSGLNDPYSV